MKSQPCVSSTNPLPSSSSAAPPPGRRSSRGSAARSGWSYATPRVDHGDDHASELPVFVFHTRWAGRSSAIRPECRVLRIVRNGAPRGGCSSARPRARPGRLRAPAAAASTSALSRKLDDLRVLERKASVDASRPRCAPCGIAPRVDAVAEADEHLTGGRTPPRRAVRPRPEQAKRRPACSHPRARSGRQTRPGPRQRGTSALRISVTRRSRRATARHTGLCRIQTSA